MTVASCTDSKRLARLRTLGVGADISDAIDPSTQAALALWLLHHGRERRRAA